MFESFERYDVKKAFGKYYLFQKDNFIVIVELNIIGGKIQFVSKGLNLSEKIHSLIRYYLN